MVSTARAVRGLFVSLFPYYLMHLKVNNKKSVKIPKRKKKQQHVRNLSLNRLRPARYIPEGLIAQVFARLPVNSVIRFKPVSKFWNSLTRDSQFPYLHAKLNCSKPPGGTLFLDEKERSLHCHNGDSQLVISPRRKFSMNLPPPSEYHHYRVSNSVDGLICIHEDTESGHFLLANPATNKSVRLQYTSPNPLVLCNLALAYDVSVEKYKIVRIFCCDDDRNKTRCQILTLGSGSETWRDIGDTPIVASLTRKPVVSRSGIIYWEADFEFTGEERAVSLDIRSEKFSFVPFPEDLIGISMEVGSADLDGHLCLFTHTFIGPKCRYMYVHVLVNHNCTKNGQTWKGYQIDLHKMEALRHTYMFLQPVSIWDGKILLADTYAEHLLLYDLDKGMFCGEPIKLDLSGFIPNYSESLLSPIAIRGI